MIAAFASPTWLHGHWCQGKCIVLFLVEAVQSPFILMKFLLIAYNYCRGVNWCKYNANSCLCICCLGQIFNNLYGVTSSDNVWGSFQDLFGRSDLEKYLSGLFSQTGRDGDNGSSCLVCGCPGQVTASPKRRLQTGSLETPCQYGGALAYQVALSHLFRLVLQKLAGRRVKCILITYYSAIRFSLTAPHLL